jgi:hypothetical protein
MRDEGVVGLTTMAGALSPQVCVGHEYQILSIPFLNNKFAPYKKQKINK